MQDQYPLDPQLEPGASNQQALIYAKEMAALFKAERARHERLIAIIENMSEGFLQAGADLCVSTVNLRATEMLGKSQKDVLEKPLSELLSRAELSAELQAMRDGNRRVWRCEVRPNLANVIEATFAFVAVSQTWTVLLRDVTEERRIANMRREILNLLAHELRTPLATLVGMERLFEKSNKDEIRETALTAMRASAERLHRSIDQILDIAGARMSHVSAAVVELDLSTLLQGVCERISSHEQDKKIDLKTQIEDADFRVTGDGDLLTRAFEELIKNAYSYSSAGGLISVTLALAGSENVEVSIEDDGPGIQKAEREKVFAPFYQIGEMLTRSHDGLGLGLALVRRIAEIHGGEVSFVDPLKLRGARVVLRLPIANTSELARVRTELAQAQKQNLVFASDLARAFSVERQEHRILGRTQNQLARSAKLATLGQMVAAIAHDVGNMISPVAGYADLLLMIPGVPENGRKYAERIQQASGRATKLLRSLVDFGANRDAKRTTMRLDTIIQSVVALLEYNLNRKGVKVVIDIQANLPAVTIDPGQIEQVLVNLVINAKDSMEKKGGGELRISAAKAKVMVASVKDANQTKIVLNNSNVDCIRLDVTDQGEGISPDVMDRLFEPFFTTKEKGKGTGLGLFICHDIVEQHGGVLDVVSTVGMGTTFSINLPIAVPSKVI